MKLLHDQQLKALRMALITMFGILACLVMGAAASPIASTTAHVQDISSVSAVVERIAISLLSSLVGGGLVILIFNSAVEKALHKSDALKILVQGMVDNHPAIKNLKEENVDISKEIKEIMTDMHQIDLKLSKLSGGIEQIKGMIRSDDR